VRLRFGSCTVDGDTRQLRRDGVVVHVSPKAFQLLEALLAARPRALSKKELYDRLWPGTYVLEANLGNLVAEVRAAIGDDARHPLFVRTVHGFGYAFSGEVAEEGGREPSRFLYRLEWRGGAVPALEGEHLLGRHPDALACVEDASVSRRHARLRVQDGHAVVEDLGSRNGTFVRGQRISGPARIEDGEVVRLGSVDLTFRAQPAPGFPETRS
jgi:DNA-binding winged helix-turn-helix (wHTH) protein